MNTQFLLLVGLNVILSSFQVESASKSGPQKYWIKGVAYQNGKIATIPSDYNKPGTTGYTTFNQSICSSTKIAIGVDATPFKAWLVCTVSSASSKEIVVSFQLDKSRLTQIDPLSKSFIEGMRSSLTKYTPPTSETKRYYYGSVTSLYAGAPISRLPSSLVLATCLLVILGKEL